MKKFHWDLWEKIMVILSLSALGFTAYLGKAHEVLLRGIDSNIHASVALSLTAPSEETLDFPMKAPRITNEHGDLNPIFNDHPFTFFWLNGKLMRGFGASAWSARLLTAVFSVGCVLLILWLGMLWHSFLYGLIASIFFLFSRDMILTGATFSLDPPMLFFILASYLCWEKKKWIGLGVVAGFGLWVKTPVVLMVFPVALGMSYFEKRWRSEGLKLLGALGLALGLGAVHWGVVAVLAGERWVLDYWTRQVWGTAVEGRGLENRDWFAFFKLIKLGFMPGWIFSLLGVVIGVRQKVWRDRRWMISLVSVVLVVFVVSSMRFSLGHYFNPAFPFLAFLASYSVSPWLEKYQLNVYRALPLIALLLTTFLVATPTPLAPETFEALKRFMPLIQSQGNCEDTVFLIPGGEPRGSTHDYGLVIHFYTGRKVQVLNCSEAKALLEQKRLSWLILSGENIQSCLGGFSVLHRQTLSIWKVENQYLLSTQYHKDPNQTAVSDLTPLLYELKPSVDCRVPPLPKL